VEESSAYHLVRCLTWDTSKTKVMNMARNVQTTKPAEFVHTMYLRINNISQGFAVAILIQSLSERFMNASHNLIVDDFYILVLALTSLFISIIFWTRYYFDTEVIKRTFSVKSVTWFFLYIIAEGFSFKQITEPANWLFSTGIFLFFGFGFYLLNLSEIPKIEKREISRLKTKENIFRKIWLWLVATYRYVFKQKKSFRDWQKERLADLAFLCVLSFVGGGLVLSTPLLIYPISIITLFFSIWQLSKSKDYKKNGYVKSLTEQKRT